ncbi:MAG TPA: kelch repeat-containing protein, partial [Phycisphaerales bacterium]|nr:kelch repeat-containing protein [Phycisphaerales bacterium]
MNQRARGVALAGLTAAVAAGGARGQGCYQWHEIGPGPAVVDTWFCAMSYFPAHEAVMLFDGRTGEQWEWDGLGWDLVGDLDSFFNNIRHPLLCYDSSRGVLVLVGGNFAGIVAEWDGGPNGWDLIEPSGDPLIAGESACVVFDEARAEMLFIANGQMHRYDGSSNTSQMDAPPLRYGGAAYDPVRERVVYFGGFDSNDVRTAQTWEWDGQAWTELDVPGPSARAYHTLTYDPARGTCTLFGGDTGGGGVSDETWEWDGQEWTLVVPDQRPPARWRHVAAYDERYG